MDAHFFITLKLATTEGYAFLRLEYEVSVELAIFEFAIPQGRLKQTLGFLEGKSEWAKTPVYECHSTSTIVKVGIQNFYLLRNLQVFVRSKGQLVRFLCRHTWSKLIPLIYRVLIWRDAISDLPNVIIKFLVPREIRLILIFFYETFIFLLSLVRPDLVCQNAHPILLVDLNEFFRTEYLPDHLLQVQIVEKDCRVPILRYSWTPL